MSLDVDLQERVTVAGVTTTYTRTKTGSIRKSVSESVPDSSADFAIGFTLDVSACKFFSIVSTVSMVVETNNGTTPINTLTLIANQPYIWAEGFLPPFLLTTDVTSIFATTGAVGVGTLTIESLEDATP